MTILKKEVLSLYAKRVLAVILVLILFAVLTFSGILYTDHEIRRTGFGENVPFLSLQTSEQQTILQAHLFGKLYRYDISWLTAFLEKTKEFLQDYAPPVR